MSARIAVMAAIWVAAQIIVMSFVASVIAAVSRWAGILWWDSLPNPLWASFALVGVTLFVARSWDEGVKAAKEVMR